MNLRRCAIFRKRFAGLFTLVNQRDLSTEQLQEFVDSVFSGENRVQIDRRFSLNEIAEAHRYRESNQPIGKLVDLI